MKRRWLLAIFVIAFAVLAVTQWDEMQEVLRTLGRGHWPWVLAALLLQGLYYVLYAALYQAAFMAVGVQTRLWPLLPVMLESVFVNAVAPSLGASAAAVFVNDASHRGQPPAAAAAATVLVPAARMTTLSLLLLAGVAYLVNQNQLRPFELAAIGVLVLVNLAQIVLLLLALRLPGVSYRLLTWIEVSLRKLSDRLRRPPWLPKGWGARNAHEFSHAAAAIAGNGRWAWRALGLAVLSNAVNLASLFALFLAFYRPVDFGVLIAGFAMGTALGLIEITPQGVGVVEGAMAITYTSLGIPAAVAAAVVISFRGLNVALPTLAGFLIIQARGILGRR